MDHKQSVLDTMDGKLVAALLLVSDLDAMQEVFVSNTVADQAPRFQRVMLAMIQAERARRDGDGPKGVEVPVFAQWPSADLLTAGMAIIAGAETAALTGDPGFINFAFRLLQLWFVAEGRRYTEEPQNA